MIVVIVVVAAAGYVRFYTYKHICIRTCNIHENDTLRAENEVPTARGDVDDLKAA